jgi:serine protease AprX
MAMARSRRPAPPPAGSAGSDDLDEDFDVASAHIRNDPEFRNSYLLLPRGELEADQADHTFSAAAAIRSTREQPLLLRQPKLLPSEVFSRLGLVDVEKMRGVGIAQSRNLPKYGTGIFTRQPALGMAACYFRAEKEEKEAFRALGDEFEFVPNFPVALPSRVRLDRVAATRGMTALERHEWPAESGVADAHRQGIRGAGVLVGVLDTGIDSDHDEFMHMAAIPFRYVPLFPRDVPPRDIRGFDTQGHGTHVCGILAGKTVGVAPEVSLSVASVIESETTRTSLVRVTYGLEWIMQQFSRLHLDQNPAVLSMSLGFPPQPRGIAPDEFQSWIRVTTTIIRTLIRANVLPVIAIGNEGAGQYRYPGVLPDVVGVGAVDFQGQVANFSGSAGPPDHSPAKPDLVGYGVGVYSSLERDYAGQSIYQRFNGTSMATPYVAGIAALYRCRQPTASVAEIRQTLLDNVSPLTEAPRDRVGKGLARFQET